MNDNFHILIVDDETEILSSIKRMFHTSAYVIYGVSTGEDALNFLCTHKVHLVVLDMRLPESDGLSLLEIIKMRQPEIIVLILTGYATVQDAVRATHIGAADFIEKQYLSEHLPKRIEQFHRLWLLDRENERLRQELAEKHKHGTIAGNSTVMLSLKETISRIGKTDTSVLVMGKTGTGKELVAREIHYQSPRASAPFVAVDCAAINESTLESELFGHVKGAFTGAHAVHEGLIPAADGGTLFFDEIGELPIAAQAKLLRSIQEREIRPVGSTKTKAVDIRVVAATNRNLQAEVEQGNFREDLFYRLNVIALEIPPLRKRGDDVILLFRFFLRQFFLKREMPLIDVEVFDILKQYSWPGNVRELQNVAGHVAAFAQGSRITRSDVPAKLLEATEMNNHSEPVTMEDQERSAILNALALTGGNRRAAAKKLKIGVATLYRKLKKYNI
ncbi:MAG: sigma-54 dependent transcriptional regulator [Spirochaetaceae bacterium]|nr:sigma-54 dependent transcriptional regulator [Spirochaetaceae bacterium]MCF7947151.1 sigma-54 dependent transcriptional regulator [Spirochaetia bacterium]MCF7950016.1 sigma-54 dependent transcriptional regulator [Spirochaetaceae bacterium]